MALVSAGVLLRGPWRRDLLRRRVLEYVRRETTGKVPTLRRLAIAANRLRPPAPARQFCDALIAAGEEHGWKHVLYVGVGGQRSEAAGMPQRRVSERDGLAEFGRQSRTQVMDGRRWAIEQGLVTMVPAGGLNGQGYPKGGRGWANGYIAGPAMGGPELVTDELVQLLEAPPAAPEAPHELQDQVPAQNPPARSFAAAWEALQAQRGRAGP